MAVDNGVAPNGDTFPNLSVTASSKKLRETERRRRRRKQKKNKKESEVDVEEGNVTGASDSKENDDPPKQVSEEVVVEYVAEQPEFEEGFEDAFRKIFDKFNFRESVASEVRHGKKEEPEEKADVKKKLNSDSDSEAEEHNNEQKENGISNKKKKLQRRMNIAELKQVSARPDVVEVWDATSADPQLLVFLKSYRNTVPVPRHWSQKRRFLQGDICENHEAWTRKAGYREAAVSSS
ncbi:hypothetical protein AALP_AA6G215400 [Arabis alpina]|uniref:DUF382 domain-containing protein n=1 Tax=Arabis alpina TaxID=50452 RepID=A0A087GQT4_ARAAL|nr:hypothetical protein AALP_AA6G215400 [Arabis alpina]